MTFVDARQTELASSRGAGSGQTRLSGRRRMYTGRERGVLRERVVGAYAEGETMLAVAERLEISATLVRRLLEEDGVLERGVQAEQRSRVWHYNPDVFRQFDSVEVAYFAGLLVADGCLTVHGSLPRLTLALQVRDKSLIERFCDLIGADRALIKTSWKLTPTGKWRLYSRVDLSHALWPGALAPWGIVPRKSYCFLPAQPMSRAAKVGFLRGWFDGDGSVNKQLWRVAGHPEALRWYEHELRSLGYDGGLGVERRYNPKTGHTTNVLYTGGRRQVHQIQSLLIGEPRLARKWRAWAPTSRTLTLPQAAAMLPMGPLWLRSMVEVGRVPSDRHGNRWYVDFDEVREALNLTPDELRRTSTTSTTAAAVGLSTPYLMNLANAKVIPCSQPRLRHTGSEERFFDIAEVRAALDFYYGRTSAGRQRMLAAIKSAAQSLGETPAANDFDTWRAESIPSSKLIGRAFGSWTNAIQEAGLELRPKRAPVEPEPTPVCADGVLRDVTVTRATELLALPHQRVTRMCDRGELPFAQRGGFRYVNLDEVESALQADGGGGVRRTMTAGVVAPMLGIQAQLLVKYAKLGVIPCTVTQAPKSEVRYFDAEEAQAALDHYYGRTDAGKQRMLDLLRAAAGELGEPLGAVVYDQWRDDVDPLPKYIKLAFGSWDAACAAAGVTADSKTLQKRRSQARLRQAR